MKASAGQQAWNTTVSASIGASIAQHKQHRPATARLVARRPAWTVGDGGSRAGAAHGGVEDGRSRQ